MPRTVPRDTLQKIADIYAKAHQELRRLGAERRGIIERALTRKAQEQLKATRAKISSL